MTNLRKIAEVTCVQFEWLATGRGAMALSADVALESVATARALLVEDTLEMRMIEAMRGVTLESRMSLVEIAEQLAAQRVARPRRTASLSTVD